MRSISLTTILAIMSAVVGAPAHAQAFADLDRAVVDYSRADLEPGKACETLARFATEEIVEITATNDAAAAPNRAVKAAPNANNTISATTPSAHKTPMMKSSTPASRQCSVPKM